MPLRLRRATSSNLASLFAKWQCPLNCFRSTLQMFVRPISVCAWQSFLERYPLTILSSTKQNVSCSFRKSRTVSLHVQTIIRSMLGCDAFDALVTKTFGLVGGPSVSQVYFWLSWPTSPASEAPSVFLGSHVCSVFQLCNPPFPSEFWKIWAGGWCPVLLAGWFEGHFARQCFRGR